jgi:hypothetical protein
MLSTEIQQFIRRANASEGFKLEEVLADTLIQIRTRDHTYLMLVTEPASRTVVVKADHPQLQKPRVFYLQGSTGGGSVVRMGWVGKGLHLRMNFAEGGVLTTTPIESFEAVEDESLHEELTSAAKEFDSRETVSPEEFDKAVEEIVRKEFPVKFQQKILEFLNEFCPSGKGTMLGIFHYAHKAEKLEEAIRVLEDDYEEHWQYRPPPFRGSFITEVDVDYVEGAYRKLSLPLPTER